MRKFSLFAAAATVALGLAATASDSLAGTGHGGGGRHEYSYAVKFVCGTEKDQFTRDFYPPVVQGTYATAINIYNPNDFPVPVDAGAFSTSHSGPRGSVDARSYNPSFVNKIDCDDLYRYFRVSYGELLKGIYPAPGGTVRALIRTTQLSERRAGR